MQILPFITAALLAMEAYALSLSPRINLFQDVLLFDGLAFQNTGEQASVALQSFVFLRQIDLSPLSSAISSALSAIGIDAGEKISTAIDRTRLFAAVPLSSDVPVNVDDCKLVLSGPSHGMVVRNFSLCDNVAQQLFGAGDTAVIETTTNDGRAFNAVVYSSEASGFGVISDIDDTVKVSHVLDKAKLAQATLLDEPVPVEGMPELYASLATSLDSPQFIYVSGSPFQLYPFLQDFIETTYSASKGPILLQNLTLTSLSSILDFAASDGVFEYKSAMIDRIKGMYPQKRFLLIGDSTQKDPETYGEAFRKYGDFVACSWIRRVDGANNSDDRFAAAFAGVPTNKFRIYNDSDIPNLHTIDVAGGEC